MLILATTYGFLRFGHPEFFDTLIGGSLATFFGIVVGLQLDEAIQHNRDARRTLKVLQLTRKELMYNLEVLSTRNTAEANDQRLAELTMKSPLKDSLWTALSDSGDLEAIGDVQVLDALADAYHAVRHLKALENRLPLEELAAMQFKGPTFQSNVKAALILIADGARHAETQLSQALRSVDERLGVLQPRT